jgi:hypothetical protein
MAVIVVAGQARTVGKTSVIEGIIAATREKCWTAIKISPHEHAFRFTEEMDRTGSGDSSRYLAAGAAKSYLVTGELSESMPRLIEIIACCGNSIIESNRILEYLKPDLAIAVLDPDNADVKRSLVEHLDKIDLALAPEGAYFPKDRAGISTAVMERTQRISFQPPNFCNGELVAYVRHWLKAKNEGAS